MSTGTWRKAQLKIPSAFTSEDELQAAIFKWAGLCILPAEITSRMRSKVGHVSDLMFAVPNGGKRSKAAAVMFKRTGVKAGVPDICIHYPVAPFAGAFLELKQPSYYPRETQRVMMYRLHNAGYYVGWTDSFDHARAFILGYLAGTPKTIDDPRKRWVE